MKYNYNLSDKIIAWLALLSGLTISAVAIWYSVAGLVSIFAAAVIPIIVMGVALEISKLIATVWLKLNWLFCRIKIGGFQRHQLRLMSFSIVS